MIGEQKGKQDQYPSTESGLFGVKKPIFRDRYSI